MYKRMKTLTVSYQNVCFSSADSHSLNIIQFPLPPPLSVSPFSSIPGENGTKIIFTLKNVVGFIFFCPETKASLSIIQNPKMKYNERDIRPLSTVMEFTFFG